MLDRRIVITGLGALSPFGSLLEDVWKNAISAQSYIKPITYFKVDKSLCPYAGQLRNNEFLHNFEKKLLRQTDKSTLMAMNCLDRAITDAKLSLISYENNYEIGVYLASSFGGIEFSESELYTQIFLGGDRVSAYQAIAWFYAATQGQWTISRKIKGFSKSLVGDRTGGLQAIIMGAISIGAGQSKVMLCGGSDAPLTPFSLAIHYSEGLLADMNCVNYAPFNISTKGMILGEGCGIVVLEELEHALKRGAHIYGEITGFSMANERLSYDSHAYEIYASCLQQTIDNAGIEKEEIDSFIADGIGIPSFDTSEALAYQHVFTNSNCHPLISVPKSMTGHCLAAASSLDVIMGCCMLHNNMLLPTINVTDPLPEIREYLVRNVPLSRQVDNILVGARGSNGMCSSLLITRFESIKI